MSEKKQWIITKGNVHKHINIVKEYSPLKHGVPSIIFNDLETAKRYATSLNQPTDSPEVIEAVARAIQKDFPVVRTGVDADGNWYANILELEIFERAAHRAITAYKQAIKE